MFSLMGNCFVWIKERREPPRKVTLALVGLDNAGKTTALKGVQGESLDNVAPTVGFSTVEIKFDKFQITVYDLGGGEKIRGIWHNYYAESHAVVFVIDAADQDRLDESKETLKGLLSNPKIQGKPLLVLANKQDREGALDEIDICEQLNLEDMVNESKSPCRVETCSATIGIGKKMDKSIKAGFKWLLLTIGEEWDELSKRVEEDSEEQREQEAQERRERIERVRKIREQREKDEEERRKKEGLEKEESEEDDDDDVRMGANPFKPVDTIKFGDQKKKPKKEPKKQEKLPEDSDEDMDKKKHRSYASDDDDEITVSRKSHKSPKVRRRKSPSRRHRSSDDEDEDVQYSTPKSTPRSRTKKPVMRSFYLSDSDDNDTRERGDARQLSDEDRLSDSHSYDMRTDKRFHKQKKKKHNQDNAMDAYYGKQTRDSDDSDKQYHKQSRHSDDDVSMETYFGKQSRENDIVTRSPKHHRKSPRIIHVKSSEEDEDDEGIEISYSSKKSKPKESLWQQDRPDEDEDSMIMQMRKEVAEESDKKKKKKKKTKKGKGNKLAPMPVDGGDDMKPPPLHAPLPLPSWAQPPSQRNILASRAPRLEPLMEKNSPRNDNAFGATNWGLAEDLPELPRRTKPNTDEDDEIIY